MSTAQPRPTVVLRYRQGGGRNLWLWCPGCEGIHLVTVPDDSGGIPKAGPVWTWDGNIDRPTIGPSIKVEGIVTGTTRVATVCHSYVEEGKWRYLDDSTHPLAGQTVSMVPIPEGWP